MVIIILISIVGIFILIIGTIILLFNIKRIHVIRCGEKASSDQLENIYKSIDEMKSEEHSCAILVRTNKEAKDDKSMFSIPVFLNPWSGMYIEIYDDKDITFKIKKSGDLIQQSRGKQYRTLNLPSHKTKSGKLRNTASPDRLIYKNPDLRNLLKKICPKYPNELLAYLLMAGAKTFEYEELNQAKFGGNPDWAQSPQFPKCKKCDQKMKFIFQIPGSMIPGKPLSDGMFYFFGCGKDLNETVTITQFT